jgi:hypothetical protein
MMMTTFKTFTAAAGLSLLGTMASAATVAEITVSDGIAIFFEEDQTGQEGVHLSGQFSAFLDLGFDPNATNDFLFKLDLTATSLAGGPPVLQIDEEFTVPGITGNGILGFTFGLLAAFDTSFPFVIDNIIAEVTDGDFGQTNIVGDVWLGFTYTLDPLAGTGTFNALLTEFEFDGSTNTADGFFAFDGSATISTVSPVPLPASLPLLAFGSVGLMALGRRRKAAA